MNSKHHTLTIISPQTNERVKFKAGIAQFGSELKGTLVGFGVALESVKACEESSMAPFKSQILGHVVIVERGACTFIQKARIVQKLGAVACIVVDEVIGTSEETLPMFAMSGDGQDDVYIPVSFLYHKEGHFLIKALKQNPELIIELSAQNLNTYHENESSDSSESDIQSYAKITELTRHESQDLKEIKEVINKKSSSFLEFETIQQMVDNFHQTFFKSNLLDVQSLLKKREQMNQMVKSMLKDSLKKIQKVKNYRISLNNDLKSVSYNPFANLKIFKEYILSSWQCPVSS